jgi:VWFA-related protein
MPRTSLAVVALIIGLSAPLWGQGKTAPPYRIDFDPSQDVSLLSRDDKGKKGVFINVRFTITLEAGAKDDPGAEYKVVIEEDGRRVREEDVPRPAPIENLSVMLALDTSGSMKERGRMAQAKAAADAFLHRLPTTAECGLILFDHELRKPPIEPGRDRVALSREIRAIEPRGGTAYLDATFEGITILSKVPSQRERAVVVVTDGVDLNSAKDINTVVNQAIKNKVRVYAIGIGEPGKQERVSTVLALDHSGSMRPPADELDKTSKIQALRQAARRFVEIMPAAGLATVLPFSSDVGTVKDFTNKRFKLTEQIDKLNPDGETALFDATYAAIAVLEAENPPGKRAVVAMTDGIDNSSRRRVEEVIERAKEAKVPLYMLGFGREGEVDSKVMEQMARETNGRYYHAKNEKALLDIFENLSIELHDDGIDEIALRKLSGETGGQYFPAKNVADLRLILEEVSQKLQHKRYVLTFPSLRQVADGTFRNVTLKLVRRSGGEVVSNQVGGAVQATETVVEQKEAGYQLPGIVVAEMHHLIFLGFLILLGTLIALPSMLRRTAGSAGQGAAKGDARA